MNTTTAFVTGSTGLLGVNLISQLASQGVAVKALVRSEEKGKGLLGALTGVELIKGDIDDVDGFAAYLKGCDVIFHAAAYFTEYYGPGDHWQKLERLNTKATIRLLEAAEEQGIKKAIYVSSSGSIGLRPDGGPGTESTPPGRLSYSNLYFKSKLLAEQEEAKFSQQHQMPVVLILPGTMMGPADTTPTGTGQLIIDFLKDKIPGVLEGGMPLVDARDVAAAMIAAVEKGRGGERYLVGGTYRSIEEILQTLQRITGKKAPTKRIPSVVVNTLARIAGLASRLTGKPPALSLDALRFLQARLRYDSSKAIRELSIKFRQSEETIRDTLQWYQEHGTVRC